ncbi:MAG: lipocalin family protein [Gillisia sp.]|nr:lipocalin family protein [Gillisia sp.]
MKKITYLFVMVFAVMLSVSCSGDDDSSSDLSTNALVGTWGVTEIAEGMEMKVRVTFNANNSGTSVLTFTFEGETETETENFSWSTSGNKLTISSSGESEVVTYAINGNKLTITDQDGEVVVLTKQ